MSVINLASFQQEALLQHNYYRQQLHCTGAMVLNASISTTAQNYAQYLAANNIFNHSQTPGLGENLWMESSSAALTSVNGSVPTIAWYSEISSYNYSNPGFSSATGHFTQVVWSDSVQLGIGIALTSNNLAAYVVANYYPPGNYLGQFATKVPSLCTTTTTSVTTTSAGTTASVGSSTIAGTTTNAGSTTSAGTTTNAGSTTSVGASTNGGTTVSFSASNNTAVSPSYHHYYSLVTVITLGTQFYQIFY
ncbi:unnamed protein product [Adineta steineri]|uniref:SCP domain-containing protein n=1 Tax=Adineta steineri TaxID=433720 RepID=A0A818URA0_9BILA|nr:unnamed protein product [Adineta steineri]CAF3698869.1 unnamed protein product [Adineta steineri]